MHVNFNNRKRAIVINAVLIAVLFGLISLNKEFLRPTFNNSGVLKTLTGCFPNFIAAYIISLCIVVAVLIRKFKQNRIIVYTSSIAVSVILILEELIPMWGASEHYDIFDIIASVVGSFFAIITFEQIHRAGNGKKYTSDRRNH